MTSHWNPIHIQRYLAGAEYPTSKERLIEYAREQGAPEEIVEALDRSSTEEFSTPADLISGMSETT
jgi:hypothetical protein